MPTRLLREGIVASAQVDKLDWASEVFYRRLMSKVDDFGRCEADPVLLRSDLYPRRVGEISVAQLEEWLAACERATLLRTYEVNGKKYIEYFKLGKPRAKESRFPAPPQSADENVCLRTHVSVPLANANAGSVSGSNASSLKRRGATPPKALIEAAQKAIALRFPDVDRKLAGDIASVAIGMWPAITAPELTEIIRLAYRKHAKKAALYLTTVAEELERRIEDDGA